MGVQDARGSVWPDGPRRSRTRKQALFKGWVFALGGDFKAPAPSAKEIQGMIKAAGGTVVDVGSASFQSAVTRSAQNSRVLLVPGSGKSSKKPSALAVPDHVTVAAHVWFLNCVCTWSLLPVTM